jgi:hypothetical protein
MSTCTESAALLLPSQPYLALHPHYGMLLGVDDFAAEQAYHRGKQRLHNAWAHGWGVLWGLAVSVDLAKGEVAVAPGLAYDGRGRELHVDQALCLHVGRWFAAHRDDPGFSFTEAGGNISFDAHVRISHHACLTQPVPALADSCNGAAASGTAYARVFETVKVELVPGLAPPRTHRHHLLRVLAGLDEAATDEDGNVLAADQQALDARAAIAAATPADKLATAAAEFHRIAVLATSGEGPALDQADDDSDDPEAGLFPAAGPTSLALADLPAVQLSTQADGSYTLTAANADNTVRSVLLPSATLQALGGALLSALV